MFKKILKGLGVFLAIVIIALAITPFLFKDKIKELVLKSINEKVDATVAFEDVSLSLFKNFPKANITIDKLSIINKAPFAGDTLIYSGELNLKMSVKELFKADGEAMELESFSSKNGLVNIIFNKFLYIFFIFLITCFFNMHATFFNIIYATKIFII